MPGNLTSGNRDKGFKLAAYLELILEPKLGMRTALFQRLYVHEISGFYRRVDEAFVLLGC